MLFNTMLAVNCGLKSMELSAVHEEGRLNSLHEFSFSNDEILHFITIFRLIGA